MTNIKSGFDLKNYIFHPEPRVFSLFKFHTSFLQSAQAFLNKVYAVIFYIKLINNILNPLKLMPKALK